LISKLTRTVRSSPKPTKNGNPATGYDPDTGLPVYEAPDDADADNTLSGIPRRERITGPPTDRQIALAYRLYALTGDRTMLDEIAAYNAEIAGIAETAGANEEEEVSPSCFKKPVQRVC
jgi:hypothetical protein